MSTEPKIQERRSYIRMDTVLPVQFRLVSPDGKEFLSDWRQGFTNNVGKGGICLQINKIDPLLARQIKDSGAMLALEIEIPFIPGSPVSAQARVAWFQDGADDKGRCLAGLRYVSIEEEGRDRILRFARAKQMFLPAVMTVVIVLGAVLGINGYFNFRLVKGNKLLVKQLIKVIQESNVARERLKLISRDTEGAQLKIGDLESRIKSLEQERTMLEAAMNQEKSESGKKIEEYNSRIAALSRQKDSLQKQVSSAQQQKTAVTRELERLDREKSALTEVNFHKMYRWLAVHQNPHTGLVMSFEGDADMSDQAFIYDQSLAAQVYTHAGDAERARIILEFFADKAKRENGLFFNAYYVNDGNPSEYLVHSGPNVWVGIAAVQYAHKTKDSRFMPLAEELARALMSLQSQDSDGGIRGGPAFSWYSTEHNLDAYAFFNMLFVLTGNPRYAEARDKIFKWLLLHSYDKQDVPVTRGKGDSTIATDTYAWSIAAIGPAKLKEAGMDPDEIMEFAEKQCGVNVSYPRPDGKTVAVKGFDFAPQRHLARGGVVSTEWTAQMITSFKIMAEYYRQAGDLEKSGKYRIRAEEYLGQLCNMIICSPSPSGQGEGCLPYASADFVDTGHGWRSPKGESTGCVSGTVYTIFAYYGYNPLEIK
ncbi:MAG: PilZ domain-containing protein [Candidatus Omnitrophica bacterium]|nr:PilZ domain-containing protein [Candidatus Omnitrophota bacterium]